MLHLCMRHPLVTALAILAVAERAGAQSHVRVANGEVASSREWRADPARLATRIPGAEGEWRARVRIGGDSAQRVAMHDFGWRGRVWSVEIDEQDSRLFWDVKIVPDSSSSTVVRYRVDAISGGILGIREFTGIKGLSVRAP